MAKACRWYIALAAGLLHSIVSMAAADEVEISVDPVGQLAESISVTVVNLGDDWEHSISVDSPDRRFAILRLRARSPSGSASLHPSRMRFVANGTSQSAPLIALSFAQGSDNEITLHLVTAEQRPLLVPLIPKDAAGFAAVYAVDRSIEEGVFSFDDLVVGTVRFDR